MFSCGLTKHEVKGIKLTWWSGPSKDIGCRLDRALVYLNWLNMFTSSSILSLLVASSDHCPLLLMFNDNNEYKPSKSFRYYSVWHKYEGYWDVVKAHMIISNRSSELFKLISMQKLLNLT